MPRPLLPLPPPPPTQGEERIDGKLIPVIYVRTGREEPSTPPEPQRDVYVWFDREEPSTPPELSTLSPAVWKSREEPQRNVDARVRHVGVQVRLRIGMDDLAAAANVNEMSCIVNDHASQ